MKFVILKSFNGLCIMEPCFKRHAYNPVYWTVHFIACMVIFACIQYSVYVTASASI